MAKSMKLIFNHDYDFLFLIKLLNENNPEQGNIYRKIRFEPRFSESSGKVDHIEVIFENVYVSGENNFNEH